MNQREAVLPLFPRLKISPLLGEKGLNTENPKWEEADYRLCITFLGDFFTKQTSATLIQLTSLIRMAEKKLGKKFYVDYCYQPDPEEVALFRERNIREIFGWSSYRTLEEFDCLINTFSIHYEILTFSTLLWGAGIPVFYNQRKDRTDLPVLIAGGVIASSLEPLNGHPEGPMTDLMYIGEGEENMPKFVEWMYLHKDLQRTNREEFLKGLAQSSKNLYFSPGYEHIYGDFTYSKGEAFPDAGVIPGAKLLEIRKTRDWVPDTVKFHRSFEKVNIPMFEDRILMTTNDGASRGELILSHGALVGDTIIQTENGFRKLEDIVRLNLDKQVWTSQGWKDITDRLDAGIQPVFEVRTEYGRVLRLTGDHGVDVGNRFVKAADLRSGMNMQVWLGVETGGVETGLSENEVYLMGFIQGDGSVTKSGNVIIYANEEEYAEVESFVREAGWKYRFEDRGTIKAFHILGEDCKKVREFFGQKSGYHPKDEWAKTIAARILWATPRERAIYVSGLFDADGTATPYKERFSSSVRAECEFVQMALMEQGIVTHIEFEESEKGIQEGMRLIWHVRIRKDQLQRFKDRVGFRLSHKKVRLEERDLQITIDPKSYLRPRLSLVCSESHEEENGNLLVKREVKTSCLLQEDRIISVLFVGDKQVYDLSVRDCPEYSANGFRVENCMGYGCCFFCSEGTEAGVWREFDQATLVQKMDTLKKTSAPNVLSFFSLNTNFYSTIFDLYYEVAKRFSYISVIAFRADVVSAVPDYIKFLKALGTFRITVAVEGISERIREAFLNKNLTWDQILKTAEYVFREKFVMMKFNLIFTGHETEEDFAEFNGVCEKMVKMRDELGAKTSIIWSATTLVTYNNVGLGWQPRKATICEYFEERRFRPIVQHGRKLGIRFRFNSGPEFVTQQLLIDAGRAMTEPALKIYRKYWEENKAINNGTFFKEVNAAVMNKMGLTDKETILAFWDRKRAIDELTPAGSFDVLPKFVKKMLYLTVGKKELRYCLANAANPDPKCRVCGYCEDKEFSQPNIVQRNYVSTRKIEDVEKAIFLNKPKSTLRVVYRTGEDVEAKYRFKIVNNHFLAARFLRWHDRICKDFHSVGNYSDYVSTFHGQPDNWSGFGYFDLMVRTPLEDLREIVGDGKGMIESVNKMSECSLVEQVFPLMYTPNALKKTKHLWAFETRISKTELNERFLSYKGKMKVMDKGAGPEPEVMEETYPKSEFSLFLSQGSRMVTGLFTLDGRYNPFMAIWAFFGYKLVTCKELFVLRRVRAWNIVGVPCHTCGNSGGIDIMLNSMSKLCPDCNAKLQWIKLNKVAQGVASVSRLEGAVSGGVGEVVEVNRMDSSKLLQV